MNKRVFLPVVFIVAIGMLMLSCGNSSKPQVACQDETDSIVEDKQETVTNVENDKSLIKDFYQFVFGKKEMNNGVLDKFLSIKLKKSLWTKDYEGCYEYWRFRTTAQDYNESVGDISKIKDIQPLEDGWYIVTYIDMGYDGKTEVKVSDGKIVELKPDESWSNSFDSSEASSSSNSQYSQYVGKWTYYIQSQGQRMKCYAAVINDDLTCEFIIYTPNGESNVIPMKQCVFTNGFVYFTDDGDITVKGTPRFKLGKDGLLTSDGDYMVKE